jgi:hypothetical protein
MELTEKEKGITEQTLELLVTLDEKQKIEHTGGLYILNYILKNSYLLTVFVIFQYANSATRTLMSQLNEALPKSYHDTYIGIPEIAVVCPRN